MDTPKGSRTIMATGEVKGMSESQVAKLPDGLAIIEGTQSNANNSGTVRGKVNCCESVSMSDSAPAAAKNEA